MYRTYTRHLTAQSRAGTVSVRRFTKVISGTEQWSTYLRVPGAHHACTLQKKPIANFASLIQSKNYVAYTEIE